MKKSEILKIIEEWKLSKAIIDVTDKGLISLAEKIIAYELKKRRR